MIMIQAYRVLDALVVTVDWVAGPTEMNLRRSDPKHNLAHRAFPDQPDGCGEWLPDAVEQTMKGCLEDVAALGGWEIME